MKESERKIVKTGQIVQDIQEPEGTSERTYVTPSEGQDFSGVFDPLRRIPSYFKGSSEGSGSQRKDYSLLYQATDQLRDKYYAKYNQGSSVLSADLQRDTDRHFEVLGQYYTPAEINSALQQRGVSRLMKPIDAYEESLAQGQQDEQKMAQEIGARITQSNDAQRNLLVGKQTMLKAWSGAQKLAQAGQIQDPQVREFLLSNDGSFDDYSSLINTDLDEVLKENGGYITAQQFAAWKQEYSRNLAETFNLPLQATIKLTNDFTGWYGETIKGFDEDTQETATAVANAKNIILDTERQKVLNTVITRADRSQTTYKRLAVTGEYIKDFPDIILANNKDIVQAIINEKPEDIEVNASNAASILGKSGMLGKILRNLKNPKAVEDFEGKAGELQGEINKEIDRAALEGNWREKGIRDDAFNVSMIAYVNAAQGTLKDTWVDKDKQLQVFNDTLMAQGRSNNKMYEGSWFYSSDGGLVQIDPATGKPYLMTMEKGRLKQRTWTDLSNQANKTFVQTQLKLIPQFIDAAAIRTGKSRQELAQAFNNAMIATSDAAVARMRKGGSATLQDFQGMLEEDRTASTLPEERTTNTRETRPISTRSVEPNETVKAPVSGTVSYSGPLEGQGDTVIISDSDGRTWMFFGESSTILGGLKTGSKVNKGDPIYKADSKGNYKVLLSKPSSKNSKLEYLDPNEYMSE